jgi:cholesterol transport system auxiliary component
VQAGGLTDGSSAVLYRLAYANAQQLRPYTLARWSQPPAQLVQQRLRAELGRHRALLDANDAAALSAPRPAVLRVELEEFSQVFQSPSDSVGLLRLRATLVEPRSTGVALLGQRVFIIERPAASPDAAGGTRALAEAAQQAAQEIDAWLRQWGR